MKIMLDTNVLISALVFGGKTKLLLENLILTEHELFVSKYVFDEFSAKLKLKWADKHQKLISILRKMNFNFCSSTDQILGDLRDKKDIPVLSDALFHNVDVLLTYDKDFLDAEITKPLIFSPTMMWNFLAGSEK